ncbi:hypothetical protein CJF30_00007956 [Rutstroemia sp. NJR-2017a BBW]|nr:hypothetical protein CJF30_00007956 [Rutstroemia sp. NJR-2017a BBW]
MENSCIIKSMDIKYGANRPTWAPPNEYIDKENLRLDSKPAGPQAIGRNFQFNLGDFLSLTLQIQPSQGPSQGPSGQPANKRQRSPTGKAAEGTQPKRRTVATTNRNNKRVS